MYSGGSQFIQVHYLWFVQLDTRGGVLVVHTAALLNAPLLQPGHFRVLGAPLYHTLARTLSLLCIAVKVVIPMQLTMA